MSLPWICRRCDAKFARLADYEKHAETCEGSGEVYARLAAESQVQSHTNPSHYRSHPSGLEFITIGRHMCFNLGNVLKYMWRADLKHSDGGIADLEKAAWYLNDEIRARKFKRDVSAMCDARAQEKPSESADEGRTRSDFPKVVESTPPHRCDHGRPALSYCPDCAAAHARNLTAAHD